MFSSFAVSFETFLKIKTSLLHKIKKMNELGNKGLFHSGCHKQSVRGQPLESFLSLSVIVVLAEY